MRLMMVRGGVAAATVVAMVLSVGCGGGDPVVSACTPGQSTSCACAGGRSGVQACQTTGTYAACDCTEADAGSGVDASDVMSVDVVDGGPTTVDAPVLDAPVLDAPVLDAPVLDAPVLDAPVLDAPVEASIDVPPAVDVPSAIDVPPTCPASQALCSAQCASLPTDPTNCGACGTVCPPRMNAVPACAASMCGFICNAGFRDCDGNPLNGCETNIATTSNCGACGVTCGAAANAAPSCAAGTCGFTCNTGFANCDGSAGNGCETNIATTTNCGACGNACPTRANATTACAASACAFACSAGFADCDGNAANGCEVSTSTISNCGRCDRACSAGESCVSGTCLGIPTTGLSLWLAAENISGLVDGSRIAAWPDASGNNRNATQSRLTDQPEYRARAVNGRPAVRFDGSRSHLIVPSFPMFASPTSSVTVFLAVQVRDFLAQRFFVSEQYTPCLNNFEIGSHTGDQTGPNFGLHSGCSHAVVTSDTMVPGWGVYVTRVLSTGTTPASVEIFLNGSRQGGVNNSGGYTNPGGYGTSQNDLTIGARFNAVLGALDCPHNGDLAEVIIYSRAVSDVERTQVEAYLRGKYATP